MPENRKRNVTLTIRVTPSEKNAILRKVKQTDMNMTDYFVTSALSTQIFVAEEQKRKHEAEQSGSNVGTIIGLTMGAIEAFTQNDQSLAQTQDEECQIEEENFNELLARLDEEYGYEEEPQQTM